MFNVQQVSFFPFQIRVQFCVAECVNRLEGSGDTSEAFVVVVVGVSEVPPAALYFE